MSAYDFEKSPYKFYEVIKITSTDPELAEIYGKTGAILGMSQSESGEWGYAVSIFGEEEGWDLQENEITSTGKFMKREDFYDGSSITVTVDPKTGEGKIKNQ